MAAATESSLESSFVPMENSIKWQYLNGVEWTDYPNVDSDAVELSFQSGVQGHILRNESIHFQHMVSSERLMGSRKQVRRFGGRQTYSFNIWQFSSDVVNWNSYSHDDCDTLDAALGKFERICFHGPSLIAVDITRMQHHTPGGIPLRVKRFPDPSIPVIAIDDVDRIMTNDARVVDADKTVDQFARLGINTKECEEGLDTCSICYDSLHMPATHSTAVQLENCRGHAFHRDCILRCVSGGATLKCPYCLKYYGAHLVGNQPKGMMIVKEYPSTLPGNPDCGTIVVAYTFREQYQSRDQLTPGALLRADFRRCFIPNNPMGHEILRLLRIAWDRRLIFTVGISLTRGPAGGERIVWNGIHHKTALSGQFGYPDPNYYVTVRSELAQLGVV